MKRKESGLPSTTHGSVAVLIFTMLIIASFGYSWNTLIVSARAEGLPQNNKPSTSIVPSPTLIPVKVGEKELSVTVTTPTPQKPSELQEIVAYITHKFEPEGKHVVVRAINCFYSESGLRSDAVGYNTNGTNDVGVAQINSIHGLSVEERKDWKKNIDKAYDIYKGRGNNFEAWYGKLCN